MKRLFILSFILAFQLGFAQEIKEKALLWEITGNGIEQPSYLFGTIHIACQGDVNMRPEMEEAFAKTEQLMLEIDMTDPNLMTVMMQASLSKDGKSLTEKLGEDLAEKVDSLLQEKMNASLAMLDSMNPQALLAQMSLLGLDCPMDMGYDLLLVQEASRTGKKLKGLEAAEMQIELLLSQPDDEAIKAITYFVNNFEELQKQTSNLLNKYKEQDVQGLYDETSKSFTDPEYSHGSLEEFLDNRNINWIPVIEEQIKDTPSFIACGAAHLAGKNGVINLLKEKGYTLKPIL